MASDNETSCVCDPNFAVICSFLEKFAKSCGISHPNILELQEMLENSQEVPQPLVDLHVKLLRKARKSVSGERWEKAIIKFCHSYSNQDGWEIERFGYKKARISVKLRILKMLLELQFDLNTKFKTEINRLSADELRCQPLGRDKMGQTYWCQLDEDCNLRVYREDLDDETWEVVARDRDGLVQLISQLSSNDPFRKDTEEILNEDSNSLEIEKPITDTGQAIVLQKEELAETLDDDDDEEFEEIDDDDESEDKDDIPDHGNIEKSCAADEEEDKKESNVEKKEFEVIEKKTEPEDHCILKQIEENKTIHAESSECSLKETKPAQKSPNLSSESELKPEESKEENMNEPSKPDDLLQSPEHETCLLKLEESEKQRVLKPAESEDEQPIFNSSKSKEENVINTIEFKERDTKPAESKEEDVTKTSEPREKEMLEPTESKEENTKESKGKEILKPAKSNELHVIKTTAIKENEILKLARSKEENVIKETEPKEKEILKPGDGNGENCFEQGASKDDCKLKITESKEREIESKDKCLLTPVESESSGYKELKHSKFKEDALKNDEQSNKCVFRTTDNLNLETTAKTAPKVEDIPNRFSSVNKEIERHIPRPSTNNPSQDIIPQNEFIGMDLSKPSQPRVLESPIAKNLGIDLTSKLYTEEHSLQQLVKIEDMNESSTSNSSLVAEDLSDASKRTLSNPENFDHKRFVPHPLTATDLSTKRPIDLLKSSKVTIMNSMPGFSSLSVSRLNLSGKRLHESDLMTNEAKKLRLEQTVAANCHKLMPPIVGPPLPHFGSGSFDSEDSTEVGEAIEEPLMLVRGEGSGADCNTGNPGKEEESGKSNRDSSKSDEISAGGGAGQSEKSALSNDNGNISTNKGEASGKGPEISNQETKINPTRTSSTSTISDISGGSTLREVKFSKDEKDVQINCEKTLALSVEKLTEENERCSDLNTKKTENQECSAKDKILNVLETYEAKKISDPGEDKEKSQSATNKTLCLDKHSLKEESCLQSPPKHSPKLWSIETICAPDGKSKDNPKTGSGSTKVGGNSFLGVVSDSLYGDKYSAKFQDVELGGRINPTSSSPTKRPSRWDVCGDDILQKKDQSESNDKSSVLQNASSTAADTSEQKMGPMDELRNTNLGPLTEEQNVAIDMLPAVEVSRPSKNITESRVQVCQKQKFKFDIENIISIVAEKEKTKPPLISTFDVKANTYIGQLQIAGAETQGRKEDATPEKEAEALDRGTQECQSSEQTTEKNGSGDTNASLEKLPSQGFFFGPGCLLKSPIKKTNDGINSSNTGDSEKTDLAESDSSEGQTSMSMLSEQTNKGIGESVSEVFGMKDEGEFSEISDKCSKITACAASSSPKNDSPLKSKTLHSIDTIMSTHKLEETNNIPQPTESCVPFSAEVSLLEARSCASETRRDRENPLQAKEASSGSEVKGMELVSSQSCSETLEDKVHKLSQNEKEETANQLLPKEKTNKGSDKTVFEGFSSSIFGEKPAFSDAKKECGKNISSLVKSSGLQSEVDIKTKGDSAAEQSKTCNEDNTHVKKFKSEILASGENTSKCVQSDINGKSLETKELNLFSEKSGGSSVEKESYNDAKRKGTLEVLSTEDSNKKTSVGTNDSAKNNPNTKERSTNHQQLNTVSEDREKAPTYEKKEKSDRSPNVSLGSEDQNVRVVLEEHHDGNKSKIDSVQGKEIIHKSADGIAAKLYKENKSETLNEEPYALASSSQNKGVSHVSKHQAAIKEPKLETNPFISLTEKGDLVSPDKGSMNEKLSATKTDSDQQLRHHIRSSSCVKSLSSHGQKPLDSNTSSSDLKKNVNKLVKSEPKLDEKPVISILAAVPCQSPLSTCKKPIEENITEHEDRHPKDSPEDEVSSALGKCIEMNVRNDARNEAKVSEIMNLNTLLDESKQKHENVASSEESKSKLPHLLELPEKTIGTKSMNVLKVDKVKSSLSLNVAHKHIGERADKSGEKCTSDFRINEEEKKKLLDMKLGGGISSAVSESKLSPMTSDREFQCMKSQALHSEPKTEDISSDQTNLNSGKDDSKKGTECIVSNVGCKVKTAEIITDISASISKSTEKFPDKPTSPASSSLLKTEVDSSIKISLEKTVGQSDTILKKKGDVISTTTSEDQVKMTLSSTSASLTQQKSIENSSQIEIKSVLSSADAHGNKTFPKNESEIVRKTPHVDHSKSQSEHLGEYSKTASDAASTNEALTSNNPTKECHESVSRKGVKSKSLNLSTGVESLNNSVKITKQHDLPKETTTLPFGADNKQGKADISVSSEVNTESVCPSLKSCETKTSSIVTPKTKADIRDHSEGNPETKKIVISAEKDSSSSDNFTKNACENIISNIPKDELQSKSEKIHCVKEADIPLTIPLKTEISASVIADMNTEVDKKPSTSVQEAKENPSYFHDKIKCEFDSSGEIKTKLPCLSPKNKNQVENVVSKKIEPTVSETISDNNTNNVCSAIKCETSEKTERKSLLSVKDGAKIPELDSNTVNSSLHKDDSKVSANKKDKNEPRNQNREERADNNLHLQDDAKITVTERNLAVSPSESDKNPLLKSATREENEETFQREIQPNVEQISSIAKKIIDLSSAPKKTLLKSGLEKKVIKHDKITEKTFDVGKLTPVSENLSECNNSNVLEKRPDNVQKEEKLVIVTQENLLKKNIKDTTDPNDISHLPKHKDTSEVVPDLVGDEHKIGGKAGRGLQSQNVDNQKMITSSKAEEETTRSSHLEPKKNRSPSFNEGSQKGVVEDTRTVTAQLDVPSDQKISEFSLSKGKSHLKDGSAQAVMKEMPSAGDKHHEKGIPGSNIVLLRSDEDSLEKCTQNVNDTEISTKPLLTTEVINSFPDTSTVQNFVTVDKPCELQSPIKESVKNVPSKSSITKPSTILCKGKNEFQNKGRRKSLESISMGIMMRKAAKSSLQEPVNTGDGNLEEEITKLPESAPTIQVKLVKPSSSNQQNESPVKFESHKICMESDKLDSLPSGSNVQGDSKASIQNTLEVTQITEQVTKLESSTEQLSETEGMEMVQADVLEKKKSSSIVQKVDDLVVEADQIPDTVKRTEEVEKKEATELMPQKDASVELKQQDIPEEHDGVAFYPEVDKAPDKNKQDTVSASSEKLDTEDCKNSKSKLKNTENKLDGDNLFPKEKNKEDPSSIKDSSSIALAGVESTDKESHETSNTLQFADIKKLSVNKKQEEISLLKETVVTGERTSDPSDPQRDSTLNVEIVKEDNFATISTESQLEETGSPKVDIPDTSVAGSKDLVATEQSSEEDVANDDSCYIPDNDSLADQESDDIKAASPSNQKHGQKDEEIRGKQSPVEESLVLEETGGASSSEGEQGGEPDGSSYEGESEAGATGKRGGAVTQPRQKSGRGRRGRGRGSRGRSRTQRANTGKSASPVPTGASEDDKKELEPITPVTPTKTKGNRGKRAPKLMGLDLGVDIVLEQSRGDEEGRPGAPPVRQSRRIAQMKIREEAERRKLEEMTLQQLKEEQSRRRADARAEKKEFKEGKKRKKKAIESDEDFTAEEADEEASSKKKMKKKKRRKKKPALSFNESNPWQSSSGSSTSQEEDEEGEQTEEEEDDEELIFKSDHEFSPESDLENDGTEVTPMRRARTAQKGLPCEDEEQPTDEHACQKCGKSDHPEWILLCDKCDSGWHCSCLRPALMVIPEGDWFCPPCEHTFLLENLHNNLLEFDRNWKRRENEELRRKRLAYVGISLDNVLPNKEGSGGESGTEMKKEPIAASPSGSDVSGSESGTSSDEDSEPVYQLRQRRQTLFSYRFNEYDDLINSAIQDEMEAVKGAGNQGRGKDIATIVKAEAEAEAVAQAQAQAQEQTHAEEMQTTQEVAATPEESAVKLEAKEEPISEEMEKEELPPVVPKHDIKDEEEEEEDEFCPFKKFQIRKKHRRLNSLDISSEDDAESDEDFKGTSSEDDEDEYEGSEGESEDSEFRGRRGKGSRRRASGPVRRSSRARITRFDKEFINDDSEDSEPPKKKSRKFWQDSDSEDSDASWRRSKRSKKQVTTFKTIKTKSKKKKKKRSKRDGDSDLEVYRAKKPKIKYGGLEEDAVSPTRRTRGRKINYQEFAASDSEEETWGKVRKLESEDEYVANEEEDEEEEDEVLPEQEKDSENESGEPTEMKKVNRTKQDKKIKPKRIVKSSPEKFVRKGKRGPKTNKKAIIDSEEDIPPCTGVQVPSENEDHTFGYASHQSVNTQTSEAELQSCSVVNVPIGNLPKERKGRTRGQGRKQEEQKKKGKRKKKNENASLDFTEGLAPGFQTEKGDCGLLGKQLADVQLLPAQSRMGAEISVKGGESLMQRLTAAGRTVPISLGSNPDLLPEADRAMLLQSAKGAETDPLRSLLAAPPVIPSDGDLKVSEDVPPPAGKRKGRGRGKAAAAKAVDVSHYPLQNFPQSGPGIGNTSSSSVITRMLQSQPVSGAPQSFTAAATAMGHKYFGSSSGEPSLMPMQNAGRGTSSVPPYSGPPKGLSSPYRPPPPTDTNNSGLGPAMGHYGSSPSTRGPGIRGPPGFQQTGSMRLRNPPSSGQPHMFHTSHHPMDPSPSGGGPIIISSTAAPPPPPAGSPHSTKPGTPSTSQNTPTPPPPPPYSRPGSQLPLVPPTSTTMPSMMQFPSQGDSSQPPVRHPPPPFPPSTSAGHLQTSQGTPQSSPPTHQGRSPVPGNFSPYHPPPPANYHYGGYPPPPPMSAADDALPPSAFQGSPYTDHYTSSDMTANLQASDGSNSKSYDEEGGGEFGGLVSYFSSQREDDLDT
ncbi:hypothetical protein R5R35_003175 [Gryllus longicercus]|uniref:PHD-type domain-containing protein n=1 Tax=Gryllus longicercus TaxID=2509291 RepID=A0AAN9Z6J0_9ORTH